jgi:hypothetical protein
MVQNLDITFKHSKFVILQNKTFNIIDIFRSVHPPCPVSLHLRIIAEEFKYSCFEQEMSKRLLTLLDFLWKTKWEHLM